MEKFVDFIKTTIARFSGDSPITWGQIWKLYAGVIVLYALVAAIVWIYYRVSDWNSKRKSKKEAAE